MRPTARPDSAIETDRARPSRSGKARPEDAEHETDDAVQGEDPFRAAQSDVGGMRGHERVERRESTDPECEHDARTDRGAVELLLR